MVYSDLLIWKHSFTSWLYTYTSKLIYNLCDVKPNLMTDEVWKQSLNILHSHIILELLSKAMFDLQHLIWDGEQEDLWKTSRDNIQYNLFYTFLLDLCFKTD